MTWIQVDRTHQATQALRSRLDSSTGRLAGLLATGWQNELLYTDEGLEFDGVALWLVNDEIRAYTGCMCGCDTYVEDAIRLGYTPAPPN